ncbi:carboxypeptidase-like regulatory domain-containing protein [Dyadobacter pollutisoli]|uniref:Carboxypeptidase-like regulatory domain-containing protein n=1 Tax=Dyadobacter pollutisoli TaxID=2910158 RepID=A0A9E8NDW7_9BACT|nr:carboxypeptidase-like regulatory domain-containing protein [Dyadobacter pollutisoli]WAC12522.1 carboxypeptidase-like regulatory domain-containing protein [Dyadobacter pollutisoli]
MKLITLLSFCLISCCVSAQRIVTGKVIDEFELMAIPGAKIMSRDNQELATTGLNGEFKTEIPAGTDSLLIGSVGMEWASIRVSANCDRLEIIMMYDGTFDFMTLRLVDKRRYKRFKSLDRKHERAFKIGVFTSASPCISYAFQKYWVKSIDSDE